MNVPTSAKAAPSPHIGLVCHHCGCRHFLTVYTRRRNDGIIRRKRCRNCGATITTREKII
jgi:transcriptional regulator NrdR family protein